MADDIWHFSREELAKRTLFGLSKGPSKALTLFAPRRTGKTEFLRKDFKPLAEKEGHIVVYMSFWEQPLEPIAVIIEALEKAVQTRSGAARLKTNLQRITPKVKLSATVPGTGLGGEVDLTELTDKEKQGLLFHLDVLLEKLERRKKPTILLLDEVQQLASGKDNFALVASLRTSLDIRSDGVRAIFTGSSRDGLRAMFSDREAPFFHFGAQVDLEPLGDAFVDHLINVFQKIVDRKLERNEALKAFEALHRSPYYFRGLIEMLVLEPGLSIKDGLDAYRARLAERLGYEHLWRSLSALQRAVLFELATGSVKLFAQATLEKIGKSLGGSVQPHEIQTALRGLARADILDKWSSQWRFADEEFGVWISTRGAHFTA